tara:strand:- start:273 stop:476 length:204 start_codon:yes stop_codon:yes gene_type:complete
LQQSQPALERCEPTIDQKAQPIEAKITLSERPNKEASITAGASLANASKAFSTIQPIIPDIRRRLGS